MTKRYQNITLLSPVKRRGVESEISGAKIASYGGVPLLAETDRRRRSVVHSTPSILRQHVYGLALVREELSEHDGLRRDTVLQANRRFAIGKPCFPMAAAREGD